jgi:HD-like signal output (HDOD) protein
MNRILKSPQLPSAPSVALRLLELAQDLDSCTQEVVETLKADPALTVKILARC